jgi:(R,R)-butanediol dehydrogenase / meso-butanediol dehydrogenase / diacetyl reductase
MRAAVFKRVGTPLSIETVPDPQPRHGEVVLKIATCGICGSDLHASEVQGALPEGMILGHEFAGTIVETGTGATQKAGTRVTAFPLHPCWSCDDCNQGYHVQCSNGSWVGTGRPGAFADYVTVDARLTQALPAGVGFDEGALVEPLATAHHAVILAGPLKGRNVLVLGAGPIGAGVVLFARRLGARNVLVSEPSAERRQLAMRLGATAVLDPTTENPSERAHVVCGGAPDVVFECVGVPGMIARAVDYVAKRGRVIVVGVCFTSDSFAPYIALTKGVSLLFSMAYDIRDFESVIDNMAAGHIEPQRLVTSKIRLDDLPAAFEALKRPTDQCKILVGFDL